METSQYENITDKIMFLFLAKMYKILKTTNVNLNTNFANTCDHVAKIMGMTNDFVDIDYLYNIYTINSKIIESNDKNERLTKPILKNYEFRSKQIVIETKNYYFENKISSYGNKTEIIQYIKFLESEGEFDIFTQNYVDDEVIDSETEDIQLLKNSLKKV